MEVGERIRAQGAALTGSERRVAAVILESPQTVGFGTVADLAAAASAGAATVMRLAVKLGYEGFTQLQQSIRDDLVHRLRPAAERIREQAAPGDVGAHGSVELANVSATLEAADPEAVAEVVDRLADLGRPVAVLSGDASAGVAAQFVGDLALLRAEVRPIGGNEVAARRALALLPPGATLVVVDLRRYDRWVLDLAGAGRARGHWLAALTDSYLSPLAGLADRTFVLSAGSVGPFDSHVGTLALTNLFVNGVAVRLTETATGRLDAVEDAWAEVDALTEP